MSHNVFVSYSSKDKAIADTIVAAMENNHIRCWYAPRDIKPSEDWGKAITSAIEQCRVFLVIFSKNANRSQRVLDEVNLAISQQAVILPFRIENLEPEGAMKLHLSSRHWLDAFEPSWETHIKKLIKDVSANLEAAIEDEEIVVPEGMKKQTKQRKTLFRIMGGVAGAVLLMTAGWFGWSWLNKGDGEIPELTEPETSIQQEAPVVQEVEKDTTESTPIPEWVEKFSGPIFAAIEDQPPTFSDDFSELDKNWLQKHYLPDSAELCSDIDGVPMQVSEGLLKISIDPNCPHTEITHPNLSGLGSHIIQVDVNLNGQTTGNILFQKFFNNEMQLDFGLHHRGGWIFQQLEAGSIFETIEGFINFDDTNPFTLTIIQKDSTVLIYLDSSLVISRNDLEWYNSPAFFSFNMWNDSPRLKEPAMFELDNIKVWDLDTIEAPVNIETETQECPE